MLPPYTITHQTENQDSYSLTAEMTLSPDYIFFDGHFEGFVLLPAVAQLFIAELIAEKHWGDLGDFSSLKTVKFREPIYPNTALSLHLEYSLRKKDVIFCYQQIDSETIKSSGKIIFRHRYEDIL